MQISSHFATITNSQIKFSKQRSDDFIDAHISMKFSEPVKGQYLPELTSFTNELYKKLQAQGRYEELANTFHFVTTARVIFQDRYNTDEVMPSDLPKMLAILKEPYTLQAGTYLGQPETQEHFRARKQQAIENLSEFLVQKGLLASKDEPVSAPQKISVDMYYELKFKPKDEEEFEKLLQELQNAREDLKKENLPVYQNAMFVNDKSANSPLKELLQNDNINSAPNTQIQNENAANSQQKSEFEKVVSELLWGLEREGKIDELQNVFAFVTSAVATLKFREQKDRVELSDIPALLGILKEPYTLQAGTYLGQAETAEHFNARKNQAISYFSELLAQI